jgi:hypothetical protein
MEGRRWFCLAQRVVVELIDQGYEGIEKIRSYNERHRSRYEMKTGYNETRGE